MVYCRRFILNPTGPGNWYLHLRSDASPQAGRDYLVSEIDIASFGAGEFPYVALANKHAAALLGEGRMKITPRLLPLRVVGARAASGVHKGQLVLKSLGMECKDLAVAIQRDYTMMFDFGAESAIWSLPSPDDAASRLFANALPFADCDHSLHHVPRLIPIPFLSVLGGLNVT